MIEKWRFDSEEGKKTFVEVTSIEQKEGLTIQTQATISYYRAWCLLINAWEGGSAYWARAKKLHANGLKQGKDYTYQHELPFIDGCSIDLMDASGNGDHKGQDWTLTKEKLQNGFKAMAEKYPHHFKNFIEENDDAETGDVFLQVSLFGEIVYG